MANVAVWWLDYRRARSLWQAVWLIRGRALGQAEGTGVYAKGNVVDRRC